MRRFSIALLLMAVLAVPALASPTEFQMGVSFAKPFGEYKSSLGGEYTLTPLTEFLPLTGYVSGKTSDILIKGSFQTFCIEADEPISGYPATYYGNLIDETSRGTGWLYSQFAMGSLAGYAWSGAARLDSAYALQQTIWWLEGFAVNPATPSNVFSLAVLAKFGNLATAQAGMGSEFGVYGLDLYTREQGDVQDMLFFVPDGGTTLMLLGGALMGLGAIRRKLRR
jgi:hypothetical protein